MDTKKSLTVEKLVQCAQDIRARYHALEEKHHGSRWTVEEDALAFLTDAALVGRLTMERQGRWPKAESANDLEHKVGECIWWLVALASRMDIDVEHAIEGFLATTEDRLGGKR